MATSSELLEFALGQGTSIFINDTVERKGRWKLIHVLSNARFGVLVDEKRTAESNDPTGFTFRTGIVLGGDFRNIKLSSGVIIAYS